MEKKETSIGNRRQTQKEDTRKIILESSRDLFNDLGFDKTSTREIALRAGVGVGTVFSHFPDKSSLLIAVLLDDLTATQAFEFVFLVGDMLEQAKERDDIRPEADTLLCARAFFSHYLIVLYEGLNSPNIDVETMHDTLKELLEQLLSGVGQTQ